jgi:hypothetical protein
MGYTVAIMLETVIVVKDSQTFDRKSGYELQGVDCGPEEGHQKS